MNRITENAALVAAALGLLAAAIWAMLTKITGLLVFAAMLPVLFALFAISLAAFFRIRLYRLAEEEKRDQALLAKEHPESSLFHRNEAGDESFTIGRSRAQLERYVIPAIAPLLGLALLYWVWNLYTGLPWDLSEPTHLALSGSLLGGMAFVFFLTSRFLLGMSRHAESRLLRGPGVLAGLASWGGLLGLGGAMTEHFGFSQADEWIARVLVAATALLGLENLLTALLSLYSHQREKLTTTYESKLGAMLVDPGVLTKSMTEAMDYQFGFSFSRTWLFTVLQRAALPLILVQAALLYLMSSFVFLGPHESGILERFGRPVNREATLTSGFHLKRPWPFESVRRVPTGRLQRLEIGYEPGRNDRHPDVITWSTPHYEDEDVFLVASRTAHTSDSPRPDAAGVPVSMITVNVPVEYRITNAYNFAYRFARPDEALRQLAYQAITRQLARRDLRELFSEERLAVSRILREELQALADAMELGVAIEFLGLQGVHPPVQVADAFQAVIGALEEKEAILLDARAYANRVLPVARAFAHNERVEAEAYRFRRKALAEAESEQFVRRQIAHEKSPRVYRAYQYLDMLKFAAAPSRLYVLDLPARGTQTLWLNLEEKPFSGALDMAPLMLEGSH